MSAPFCSNCGARASSAPRQDVSTSTHGDEPELLAAVVDAVKRGSVARLVAGGERIIHDQLGLVQEVLRSPEARTLGARVVALDNASGGTIQRGLSALADIIKKRDAGL